MPSRRYASTLRHATDSVKSWGTLTAQTTGLCIGWLNEVTFGFSDTPADASFRAQVQRCTTTGTGTSKTPKPNNSASPAAATVATHLISADPTLTSNEELIDVSFNQRTTFRWVAPQDGELYWPGTNVAGLSMNVVTKAAAAQALEGTASCNFGE